MCFRRNRRRNMLAENAVESARKHLLRTRARDPEVHAIVVASRTFLKENHFAADLQAFFERRKG